MASTYICTGSGKPGLTFTQQRRYGAKYDHYVCCTSCEAALPITAAQVNSWVRLPEHAPVRDRNSDQRWLTAPQTE